MTETTLKKKQQHNSLKTKLPYIPPYKPSLELQKKSCQTKESAYMRITRIVLKRNDIMLT